MDDDFHIMKLFLKELNRIFPIIQYLNIPTVLINDMINNNMMKFFQNNLRIIKIYEIFDDGFNKFLVLYNENKEIIKKFLKTDELSIDLISMDRLFGGNDLDLYGIEGIQSIDLSYINEEYSCLLDEITIKSLNHFSILNSNIQFYQNNIQFPNLISLNIHENYLFDIFSDVIFDSNSFIKLEYLTIEILSTIDYIILNGLLKNAKYLKELNIRPRCDDMEEIEFENYFKYYNNNNSEMTEENYEKAFTENNKILGNTILNLNNLKVLRINGFESNLPFINIILDKYKSNNLNVFESDCIQLSSAKTFLNNNKNLKIIKFKNENNK